MNEKVPQVYPGKEHFHKVIALHEERELAWEILQSTIPALSRGWFELSRLSAEDRIEFTRAYWVSKLPFSSTDGLRVEERLSAFFESLEDIGLFATQLTPSSHFEVHMIYSLRDKESFFHGSPPAPLEKIQMLVKQFSHLCLPPDYLSFFQIHDGFSKVTDRGLLRIQEMPRSYQHFQQLLTGEMILRPDGQIVNPADLIPFYESFGLHCYQCFYADWYPDEEMGNIFFSELDRVMSNYMDPTHRQENLAFANFLEWLLFYLEG